MHVAEKKTRAERVKIVRFSMTQFVYEIFVQLRQMELEKHVITKVCDDKNKQTRRKWLARLGTGGTE